MKIRKNKKQAFTLIELLQIFMMIVVISVCLVVLGAGLMGNQWFTEQGVLNKLKVDHPEVKKVLTYKRNILRRSVITVELNNGTRANYILDSDVLFNYNLIPQP